MLKEILILLILVCSLLGTSIFAEENSLSKKEVLEAIKRSHQWLQKQVVPNEVVKEATRKDFILSYQLEKDAKAYKYIFSKSSIYDNALAVIAFVMVGNDQKAEEMIRAIKKAAPKGEFFFNYNTHNSWPSKHDKEGALIRNGASAWMGYAISYFLKIKITKDQNYRSTPEFKEYSNYLKKIIEAILKFKVNQKDDPRYGFIRGGDGSYALKIKKSLTDYEVIEEFEDKEIEWVSIEHCMDFYFLLKEAVSLGLHQFKDELKFYSTNLVKNFWNNEISQFNRGLRKEGRDSVEALDASSWGAIYLFSIGEIEKALVALKKANSYFSSGEKWGHLPYLNIGVFESSKINRFYFKKGDTKWNDIDFIWYEGSFGVLLASYKINGVTKENSKILKNLIKEQKGDGSFVYATKEIPFQFSDRPSVASTAWFIIAASSYLIPEVRQSFWP